MKRFFCFIFQFWMLSVNGQAFDQQIQLNTPRGSMIKIDIYNPGKNLALLLAPGQGCNPRLDLYDSIASEAKSNDYTLVRLYWAYSTEIRNTTSSSCAGKQRLSLRHQSLSRLLKGTERY